jgi:L-alanine-DL-glutamate epimerase-like enolase superfamily enzyme
LKIARYEIMYADAGFCTACFLKITTDDGIVGWSEFGEHTGTQGLSGLVRKQCDLVVGMDPMGIERIAAFLRGKTFQALGGANQHATAAIINALFDIKGKAVGLPVHALFGGTLRTRLPFYWSHCGTYRMLYSDMMKKKRVRTFDDVRELGAEARERGIKVLKTGMTTMRDGALVNVGKGFAGSPGYPELNLELHEMRTMVKVMEAFRDGAGPDVQLMLDVNCHFRTEGCLTLARALEHLDLYWLELDIYDPKAMETIRSRARMPIASLESSYGHAGIRPYLERSAVDVCIIDCVWNGYLDAIKMADLCAAYDVNIATHSYAGGGLGDVVSAHLAACVPNLRIMEYDVDEPAPWKKEFLSEPLRVEDGMLVTPMKPGWGVEVNEAVIKAHPPK